MGYAIKWDNEEKTVVFQQYIDTPVKDDLYHLADESAKMLNSVPHTVNLIIDERNVKLDLSFTDIKYLEKTVPANQGAVVTVLEKSSLPYKQRVENVGKAMAPKAFEQPFYAATIAGARQLLEEKFGVHYP